MRLEGPTITFREVAYGDESAVLDICRDWTHDGKRFTLSRAEQAVHKYVLDMTHPREHPAIPDSQYTETLIAFTSDNDPLALISYTVRGDNDPKNWPLPMTILYTKFFIIAPKFRGKGLMKPIMNTLFRSAFEDTGADLMIHELVDSPEMQTHSADRYSDTKDKVDQRGETRIKVAFSKAEHEARMLANPEELSMRHIFTVEPD